MAELVDNNICTHCNQKIDEWEMVICIEEACMRKGFPARYDHHKQLGVFHRECFILTPPQFTITLEQKELYNSVLNQIYKIAYKKFFPSNPSSRLIDVLKSYLKENFEELGLPEVPGHFLDQIVDIVLYHCDIQEMDRWPIPEWRK